MSKICNHIECVCKDEKNIYKVGQSYSQNLKCLDMQFIWTLIYQDRPYNTKRWQGNTLANQSFQSCGEEIVGEFNLLTNG